MCVLEFFTELYSAFSAFSSLQQLLVLAYVLASLVILVAGYSYFERVHLTHWWDYSKKMPNGAPEDWAAVLQIMQEDPLMHNNRSWCSRWRACGMKRVSLELVSVAILTFAWWKVLQLISTWKMHIDELKIWDSGVGGIAVFLTFSGVLYTGRINSRSVSRQKWIDEIRDAISKVLHSHPWVDKRKQEKTEGEKEEIERLREETQELRAKIELLLNPAELDHRALIALLRFFYRIEGIKIDDIAQEKLGLKNANAIYENVDEFRELKSGLVRLINAMLKREWEQVKRVS